MENINIICDTDVIIEYLKGNKTTKDIFDKLMGNTITLSAITLMELFYGAINKKEMNKIKKALSEFDIKLLNEGITKIAIELIEKYSKSHGLTIPDALISSTALYYDIVLWTYNVKDFRFINGLRLLQETNFK